MKYILSALAAITLFVGVAASQPADARCFWNGFGWACTHHYGPWYWHRHHFWRPYWGY